MKTDLKPLLSRDNGGDDFSVTSAPVIKYLEQTPEERDRITALSTKDAQQVSIEQKYDCQVQENGNPPKHSYQHVVTIPETCNFTFFRALTVHSLCSLRPQFCVH